MTTFNQFKAELKKDGDFYQAANITVYCDIDAQDEVCISNVQGQMHHVYETFQDAYNHIVLGDRRAKKTSFNNEAYADRHAENLSIELAKSKEPKYTFPNIGCYKGSAWHDWSTRGAIFGYNNKSPQERKFAAEQFAGSSVIQCGAKYKAFMHGVLNCNQLRVS